MMIKFSDQILLDIINTNMNKPLWTVSRTQCRSIDRTMERNGCRYRKNERIALLITDIARNRHWIGNKWNFVQSMGTDYSDYANNYSTNE